MAAAAREILLQINGHDRTNLNDSHAKFNVSLGKDHKINNVKAIAIKSLQCVNTFYNITSYKNTWYYDVGAGELSVSITPGQYNTSSFIAAISAAFAAAGIVSTFNTDPITQLFEMTFLPPISIFRERVNGLLNPIHRVVGIRSGVGGVAVPVGLYTAEAIRDFSGLKSIYILSNVAAGGNCITSRDNGSRMALLDTLPVSVPFGGIIHHSERNFETGRLSYDQVLQNNLSTVDIELRNSENELLDTNGSDIVLILKVWY
jgi:hypothetical protein